MSADAIFQQNWLVSRRCFYTCWSFISNMTCSAMYPGKRWTTIVTLKTQGQTWSHFADPKSCSVAQASGPGSVLSVVCCNDTLCFPSQRFCFGSLSPDRRLWDISSIIWLRPETRDFCWSCSGLCPHLHLYLCAHLDTTTLNYMSTVQFVPDVFMFVFFFWASSELWVGLRMWRYVRHTTNTPAAHSCSTHQQYQWYTLDWQEADVISSLFPWQQLLQYKEHLSIGDENKRRDFLKSCLRWVTPAGHRTSDWTDEVYFDHESLSCELNGTKFWYY